MATVTVADEQMHKFLDLVRRCDANDISEIFDHAFNLLKIAVETIENGNEIAVFDRQAQSVMPVPFPAADRIRERQGRLKPSFRIV